MCCSVSNCLHDFYCCFYCWVIVLMHCNQIECKGLFLFSYIYWGLLCAPSYDRFSRRFQGLLRRMDIVQKLDEIFCRHWLGPFDLWCDLVLEFLYWFFCVDILSIGDRGALKSSTTTVLESIYDFMSFRVCLMKLGAYKLIIIFHFGVFHLLLVWSVVLHLIWSM
jgi:hypothetical protein